MNNFEIKNNESGRSMIEMLGVLAIIGVLSVGGIAGYSKAMQKYRINKTIEQITLIGGNVRSFFASQNNYEGVKCFCSLSGGCYGQSSGDGCPVIKKAKILPDELWDGNKTINPFGYDIDLWYESISKSGDNRAFSINYEIGKNEEACIELMTQDWTDAGIKAISRGGKWAFFKTPVAVDAAVTACSTSLTDLTFFFDIDLNGAFWNPKPMEGYHSADWMN